MRTTSFPWLPIARALCFAGALAAASPAHAQTAAPACGLPKGTPIFGLNGDDQVFEYSLNSQQPVRQVGAFSHIFSADEIAVELDFRPADPSDSNVYLVTDRGDVKRVSIYPGSLRSSFQTTTVSALGIPFQGGLHSVVDFNPMLDAIRLVGSTDQNFAIVNSSGGTLNAFAQQGTLRYATGDPAQGADPQITAGAYDNNFPGAPRTTFYMLDYARDTLVTIADRAASGSSNTGGGVLKTIGRLVDAAGAPLAVAPAAGLDIVTLPSGKNILVGYAQRKIFCVDLATVNPDLPVGTTRDVTVTPVVTFPLNTVNQGFSVIDQSLIDVALPTRLPTSADVAVTIARDTSTTTPVRLGEELVFNIRVKNNGPSPATGLMLKFGAAQSDVGDLDVTRMQPRAILADCTTVFGTPSQGLCVLPSAANAGTEDFQLTLRTIRPATRPAQTVTLKVTASVTGEVPDPNAANGAATLTLNLPF